MQILIKLTQSTYEQDGVVTGWALLFQYTSVVLFQ